MTSAQKGEGGRVVVKKYTKCKYVERRRRGSKNPKITWMSDMDVKAPWVMHVHLILLVGIPCFCNSWHFASNLSLVSANRRMKMGNEPMT